MSFRTYSGQQIAFTDGFNGISSWERKPWETPGQKYLSRMFFFRKWRTFSGALFWQCFQVGYFRKYMIDALIIKELFSLSDSKVIENLMLGLRYQYALHITKFAEQLQRQLGVCTETGRSRNPCGKRGLVQRRRTMNLLILSSTNPGQRCLDARPDMNRNLVDIQEGNPSDAMHPSNGSSVNAVRTKPATGRSSINVSAPWPCQ